MVWGMGPLGQNASRSVLSFLLSLQPQSFSVSLQIVLYSLRLMTSEDVEREREMGL